MDIETVKVHRSGPTEKAYIATDGKLRLYGELPTRYTPEALQAAVQRVADQPAYWGGVTQAIQMMQAVQDTADWGTITRRQARHYCRTMGLPVPRWPGDNENDLVQDAIETLEEELGVQPA